MTAAIRSGVCAAYVPGYMAYYGGLPADGVQFRDRVGRQDQVGGGDVLAQVRYGRGAWDEDDRRRALEQPGQRDLMRRGAEPGRDVGQNPRLERGEAAEREERSVGDALGRAPVNQGVVVPGGHVVQVLHGDDGRDGLRLVELSRGGRAEAEVADQAVLLQFGQGAELLGQGLLALTGLRETQVDHVEGVQREVLEVLVNLGL